MFKKIVVEYPRVRHISDKYVCEFNHIGLELMDKHIHVISQYIHTSVCNSILS